MTVRSTRPLAFTLTASLAAALLTAGCSRTPADSVDGGGQRSLCAADRPYVELGFACSNPNVYDGLTPDAPPVSFEGVVTLAGSGDQGCLASTGDGLPPSSHYLLRVRSDDGVEHELGFRLGELSPRITAGSRVQVKLSTVLSFAIHTSVEVRAGERLLIYVGNGYTPSDLHLPAELTAVRGGALCAGRDDCGSWQLHALSVTAGASAATVEPARVARVGAYDVLVGTLTSGLSSTTSCFDYVPDYVTLAVTAAAD